MKNKIDVIALGELLIDFTMNGSSDQGNPLFEANPGGAPCNVLAMLSKLGKRTAFIGKVGRDSFGQMLCKRIEEAGICADYLLEDEKIPTTLAVVHTLPDGDRDFSFYRSPGADMMLSAADVPQEAISRARIFHFGTLSMTHEQVHEATLKALEAAGRNGLLISLDPNLRPPLWSSLELAKERMLEAISYCDILKISDNEIQFLSGLENYDEGIAWLRERYDITLICLTLGRDGSRAYYKDLRVEMQSFPQEQVVDTTGAGDTFCGCMLSYVLDHGLEDLQETDLKEMLAFANAAASMVVTRKGALCSMPEQAQVQELLERKMGC